MKKESYISLTLFNTTFCFSPPSARAACNAPTFQHNVKVVVNARDTHGLTEVVAFSVCIAMFIKIQINSLIYCACTKSKLRPITCENNHGKILVQLCSPTQASQHGRKRLHNSTFSCVLILMILAAPAAVSEGCNIT